MTKIIMSILCVFSLTHTFAQSDLENRAWEKSFESFIEKNQSSEKAFSNYSYIKDTFERSDASALFNQLSFLKNEWSAYKEVTFTMQHKVKGNQVEVECYGFISPHSMSLCTGKFPERQYCKLNVKLSVRHCSAEGPFEFKDFEKSSDLVIIHYEK